MFVCLAISLFLKKNNVSIIKRFNSATESTTVDYKILNWHQHNGYGNVNHTLLGI